VTRLYDASRIAFHQVKEHVSHQYRVPTFGLVSLPVRARGATRTRTEDPLLAKQVLYQLSYNPRDLPHSNSRVRLTKWGWEELNLRPHAYQACALTT
jgi:hypothetical protein